MRVDEIHSGKDAKAYLARWDTCTLTALHTGRHIFGQLWMVDPDTDLVFRAAYEDEIAELVNEHTPLQEYFRAR